MLKEEMEGWWGLFVSTDCWKVQTTSKSSLFLDSERREMIPKRIDLVGLGSVIHSWLTLS